MGLYLAYCKSFSPAVVLRLQLRGQRGKDEGGRMVSSLKLKAKSLNGEGAGECKIKIKNVKCKIGGRALI